MLWRGGNNKLCPPVKSHKDIDVSSAPPPMDLKVRGIMREVDTIN